MAGLKDGERRRIKKRIDNLPFEVIAYREDSETPYIILEGMTPTVHLTDVGAQELILRLQRAIDILPTSK